MSVCVNINSKEFKDLAKRLDISERSLEGIIHEYINAEGSDGSFPSDYYILSRLEGQPLTNISEAAQKLIDAKYKEPIVVDTHEEAQAVMQEMMQYFEPKNIGIKETNAGKFQVTLGPVYTSRLERTGNINTVSTPIKEEYRGKLIFAQSGTGKTSIADNVNVIDSDYLLGQILGVPTALAGSAFKLLGYTQKIEVGNKYRELIRQKISEGKTVVTANLNMLPEADVIVYNESAELSDSRTSAEDRANQYSNTEYQTESINRINEFIEQNPNKESHKLGKNQFLGNVILSDSNFNILSERLKSNTLNDMLNDFVHNFGINIEEYQGELPLFDAVERVIKARSAEDLPDAVGEAVAFMMQYNPDVKNYIAERVVADGKRTREEMFNSNGSVKHVYNTTPFAPVKAEYFKEIGKEIAKQLRRLYTEANTIHTEEIKDPFIKRIWNIISEFFNKILPRKEMVSSLSLAQERLNNYAKKAARGILSNNEGLVIASLSKPETKGLATPVNVAEAFANNPYERGIIEKMTSEGIKLAGSTSIAAYGRVLRPAENPFHDLDFASPNWTAAQLEEMLKRHFGNYQPTQVISDASGEVATRSYVVLNRPFRIEPSKLGESFFRLVDTETGEVLGSLNRKKTEFVSLSEGVQGKVLDFFVSPEKYPSRTYTFNGVDYLIADPRNALDAKVSWMRLKDIFDFNRAVMNDFAPTELPESLAEKSQTNDVSYNIEGKSLKEFLRDKGLIHTYDPSLGDTDKKAMYVTKGDGTYSMQSLINQIYTTLRMYRISPTAVSFSRTKAGNAMKVTFNERRDSIERMSDRNLKDIKKTVDFLQARIPALKGRVHYATKAEAQHALGRELRRGENSFVKNGHVYLIGRRYTQDIAIEECLHPFTATLKYENPFLYNRLLEEAHTFFPKLWEDIVANYSGKEFTAEDRAIELVTQTLARNFREAFNETKDTERKTFNQYVKQFINWFKSLFYRVNPMTGNQIIDLHTISPEMSFRELAELINTSDTEFSVGFEEKVRYNKERLPINADEKEFITESVKIPGISEEALSNVEKAFNAYQQTDGETQVTISENAYYNLHTRIIEDPAHPDEVTDTVEQFFEDGDAPIHKDGKVTLPYYAYAILYAAKALAPAYEQIKNSVGTESYLEAVQSAIEDYENFYEFIERIGGEFYYTDSRQGLLFDEEGNPTEDAYQEDGLSKPSTPLVRPELTAFQEKADNLNTQLNALLDSDLVTQEEVRDLAEQAVYFISDNITEFLENPNKVFEIFTDLKVKDGKPMTEAELAAEVEKIRGMSREELAKYITPQALLNFAKERLFSPQGNSNLNTRRLLKKANLIYNNFDAIVTFASDAFTSVEDFVINSIMDEYSIREDAQPLSDNIDEERATEEAQENGNYQQHWQIESRTQDAISRMSQLVKTVLNKLYQVRINPETGEEEIITSEFGVARRINVKDATSSILRWTQGAESLSHMVELLKAKSKDNPWVNQLIRKLEDTSGKEADFQSQFYGVMATPFQSYSLVLREKENGEFKYKSIVANERPALKEVTQSIEVAYKTNTHPLFDGGRIRTDALETLTSITNDLVEKVQHSLEENNRAEVVDLLTKAAAILGYVTEEETINMALDSTETFTNMVNNLKKISDNLNAAKNQENYDPFKYMGTNNISNFLKGFLLPITDKLEDTAVSSFYDSGKMYQSYVTPSYLTVMMNKFTGTDERFQEFLENEYGQYEWFKGPSGWRNEWLETLDGLSQSERKELFKHKVQLNFNKHNYMKNMTDIEYALSIMTEYFSKAGNAKGGRFTAWYRVPMMSNKPSSEYISMYAYTGAVMKGKLANGFSKIFQQELSRIQTVDIRAYDKANPNFIKNFDKNGKKFMMLDFFNDYLTGGRMANSELGTLINKAIKEGTEYDATTNKGLTVEENARLDKLVTEVIISTIDARADRIIEQWKSDGIFEAAKQIANLGKEDSIVEEKLREFIWNDTFAAMNILELTITDPAYYKDAEDLQKRLAQIHSPGTRANVEATDYNGNRVTDGKFRTVLLKDFDDFISNIVENLNIVFDRKISEATTEAQKEAFRALKDSLTRPRTYKKDGSVDDPGGAFWNINVADAQGYSSPASYRKKAFIFGRWSRSAEEIYNKLRENKYTYNDLQTAFQPLKPFVYGQIEKPALDINRRDIATPISKLKVPVQFKNSEYLLIMADAILQKEDTGRPNLLRAIYEVMEESAEKDPQRGIDTVQFESTCKSGLMGAIDIKQFSNMKGGETAAKLALTQAIYNEDGTYNTDTYVYEVPFENYAIQQEVPAHFKNHAQAHGSQIRYIVISDLETQDSNGNPVTYDYFDKGERKQLGAEEFKREYENNIAENIEEGLNDLAKELGIGDHYLSKKDRNIALSKVLLEEILSSPRYGVELATACTVDSNTGEFNIPLGDPIQSKRIEQLINSVIKNRVNKQEVAGGPVVQVTNFGTSKELNIRFNSKEGGLLMTRAEFEKSGKEGTFEDYIKNNQAGIAYYEVFAPIFANELFEKFADKDGNIDIETIEMINPDLLKMIGYRIPTEDKYSMAPLKIVGFLPREAGDGIMLPNDITLLTGSDFDVDKFYLMRKEISIATRMNSQESVTSDNFNEAAQEFTKNNRDEVVKYLKSQIPNRENIQLTEEEAQEVRDKYAQAIDAENRRHQDAIDRINEDADTAYDTANEGVDRRANENKYSEAQEEKVYSQIDKSTERRLERENAKHDNQIYKIEQKIERALERARDRKLDDIVNDFLNGNIFSTRGGDPMFRALKEAYVKYMFDYVEETEGRTYRNNKIVDMTWAVLTNETTASKMLTPGGFEPQKRMGYLISAYQNPAVNKTWEELNAIEDVDDLKSLCYTEKNLSFIDTHLQFYKQNSAASTALGMAAVQKVAHAVLESNGYQIDVSKALHLDEDETFTIAGKTFGGRMELDAKYNDAGALIGRTLGEFVAMFADAVKDPVANLMNINNTTMPIVTTLIRLGMPFENAALFISQPIIKRVLSLYNSENISNFVRLNDVIERQLKQIEKNNNIGDESVLKELDTITEDELIKGLRRSDDAMDYKVLKFFQYINSLSQVIKAPTYITRFNSISNAVGPLIIDNLIMEYKLMNSDFSSIYDKYGNEASVSEILNAHPILGGFYQTVNIARTLFDEMPTNSLNFRDMVFSADEDLQKTLFNDRKLLTKLSDFYQSYLLVASGAIPVETPTVPNLYEGYEFYSGGAEGSDIFWSDTATKTTGIKTSHITVKDFDRLTQDRKQEIEAEYQEVVKLLGRRPLDASSYSGKLVRRDMMQADSADAIFAVGQLGNNGLVNGGTGYATTRGIIRGVPVHLFDQTSNSWKVWDSSTRQFVAEPEPTITRNAALIGTRKLQDNGRAAVSSIMNKLRSSQSSKAGSSINKYQGLKYYIEQFPADFMRGKAKEIFRGNTLIDAIKVDIQKGRTVLKIDTTGLTPQEKAKLSDGWADLYRSGERGKALAEHLFYYNFFRTGIGFSPKSFMALFPTRLKGKIRGYNEAFRVHTDKFASNVSGDMVLDQFVRNNANDNKLAPKIKLGKDGASYTIENGLYVFRDKNFDFVSGKPYIKIKVNGKDTLLKRVSEENKLARVVSYEELSLLGNDGEFFEVFTDPNYKPIMDTQTVREQVEEGETDEVSPAEVDLGEGNTQTPVTTDEQKRRSTLMRNILLKIFESTGRTREQSENKMKQYKDKSNEEKEGLKDKMKDFFKNRLEKLGIKYDEDLVDELYEELC